MNDCGTEWRVGWGRLLLRLPPMGASAAGPPLGAAAAAAAAAEMTEPVPQTNLLPLVGKTPKACGSSSSAYEHAEADYYFRELPGF